MIIIVCSSCPLVAKAQFHAGLASVSIVQKLIIICADCSLPIVYIDVNAVPGKLVYGNGIKVSTGLHADQ